MSLEAPTKTDIAETALIALTAKIVSAYVGNNTVSSSDLPLLINSVHASLNELGFEGDAAMKAAAKPAVPIKKSIHDDYLICLEDGGKFKSLRRHLRSKYDMSPEQYRDKWDLPSDYPMVSPSYARQRSMLAKKMGLGQSRGINK